MLFCLFTSLLVRFCESCAIPRQKLTLLRVRDNIVAFVAIYRQPGPGAMRSMDAGKHQAISWGPEARVHSSFRVIKPTSRTYKTFYPERFVRHDNIHSQATNLKSLATVLPIASTRLRSPSHFSLAVARRATEGCNGKRTQGFVENISDHARKIPPVLEYRSHPPSLSERLHSDVVTAPSLVPSP